jgi:alpha-1,3-rhamnosyl/mannosyltransferase
MHVIGEGVAPVFRPAPRDGPHDEALRAPAGLGAGRGAGGYVAWVGSLRTHEPRKAVDTLLRAASEMAPRPMLVLVGQGGEEADRVQRLANDLGVRTVCTGFVDDATLAAVYRGAGAVAIPSLQEGFGLPMLEAMACGVPVVASDTGNLAWLGRDGAAALVPPGDSHALAAALAGVLGDHGVAARLRAAGVRRAEEHTWHEAAVRTVEVYREVAAGCSR